MAPAGAAPARHGRWSYCPRQCGLIHLEQTFDENYCTLKGNLAHARVDAGVASIELGTRIARDVPVWSERVGLVGKVDTLELRGGVPYPVEYKSGAQRAWEHEAIQLCAQAMCLEEMLGTPVPAGSISYLASKRRRDVRFSTALRQTVEAMTVAIRQMLEQLSLPPACSRWQGCSGRAHSTRRAGWRVMRHASISAPSTPWCESTALCLRWTGARGGRRATP